MAAVLARIGETDCEELGDGWLVQPVNAVTSFAYVAVGIAIAIVATRRVDRPLHSYVYAISVAAIGLGSVAFHGPQPVGSRVMHDLPILITAVYILCDDAALLRPQFSSILGAFGIGAVAATALTIASPDAGAVATGVVLVAVGVAEVIIHRRRLRSRSGTGPSVLPWVIVGVALVAGASWLLGRTDGPACDPGGILQFHGVWHAISSLLFGLWWWLAMGPGAPSGHRRRDPDRADAALQGRPRE